MATLTPTIASDDPPFSTATNSPKATNAFSAVPLMASEFTR
jgi:hypothetical protein